MEIIQSIVLGTVQGLTEFIPISSSGHLVLIRILFGWDDPGVIFDLFLHFGTLIAVIIYFRKDWVNIITGLFNKEKSNNLFWMLVISTIPTFIFGFLLKDIIDEVFRDALWVSTFLILTGFVFLTAERFNSYKIEKKNAEKTTWRDALWIGIAQVFALLPGVSRSGLTISSGLFRSLKRTEATRFSFLMATIAIAGASVFGIYDYFTEESISYNISEIAIGFLFAFIFGYLSIRFLIKFFEKHKLTPFAIYLIVIGIIVFAIQWI